MEKLFVYFKKIKTEQLLTCGVYLLLLISVLFKIPLLAGFLTLVFLVTVIRFQQEKLAFYLGIFSLSFDQIFVSLGFSLKIHMLVFLVVFLSTGYQHFREKKLPHLPLQTINSSLLLFLIFSVVATFYASDKTLSLRFLAALVYAVSVFYLTFHFVRSQKEIVSTITALTLGMVISMVIALAQYIGYYNGVEFYGGVGILEPGNFARPRGIFDHPNFLANFLLVAIPLIVTFGLWENKKAVLKYIIIPVSLVTLVVTFSRAAYIGITSIVALILFLTKELKQLFAFTKYLAVVVLIAAFLTTSLFYFVGPLSIDLGLGGGKNLVKRVNSSVNPEAETNVERLQIWHAGLKMLNDNLLRGVGLENFKVRYHEYKLPEAKRDKVVAHNTYLQLAVEIGIFGFIAFSVFILTVFTQGLIALFKTKNSDFYYYILLGGMAAFLGVSFQNLTNSVLYYPHIWFLYGFLLAVSNLALGKK